MAIHIIFLLFLSLIIFVTAAISDTNHVNGLTPAPACTLKGYNNISALNLPKSPDKIYIYEVDLYQQNSINCTAPYPVDFEFDGVPPESRELRVKFFNNYQDHQVTFGVLMHYLETSATNPSGKYSFFSVDNPELRTSLYVFDANIKLPQLFRANTDDNRVGDASVIIGCRVSVLGASVLLSRYDRFDVSKKMERIGPSDLITYESSQGFSWNITSNLLQDDITNYTYVCECEKCLDGRNSLEFTFTPGDDNKPKIIPSSLSIQIKVVNDNTQIICLQSNITLFRRGLYLANIQAINPRQLSLIMECLPKSANLVCSDRLTAVGYFNTVTLPAAHNRGLIRCSHLIDESIQISKEYFRGIDDVIYYDWNVALKSSNALLKLHCLNEEKIYSNLNYTFTCEFNSYILTLPSFFQLHYKDGSTKLHMYTLKHKGHNNERTREVTFTLYSNISKVSCSSLPWNSSVFVNSSMNFTLRDKRLPEFETYKENLRFLFNSTNIQIQCIASGDELPEITWEKNEMALNETNLAIKKEPGSSTIFFPQLSYEHKGNYKCIANNSEGTRSKMYYVDIVENSDEINYELVVGLTLGVTGILIITIVASYVISRRFFKNTLHLTKEEINEFKCGSAFSELYTKESENPEIPMENIHSRPYDEKYEIHSSAFQIDRSCILGSGQFGIVYKGLYNHEPIAIKTLKPNVGKIYLKALLSELKVMIYINGHENIVNLIGANTESLQRGQVYVFVEFCSLGSLERFLRRHQSNFVNQICSDDSIEMNENADSDPDNLYTKNLILWSIQISSGMEYLAKKAVIHGDLATRNILLANRETIKITDFGLARKLYDYAIYEKKSTVPLPWRWMAIESLQNMTFSTKSDVWSFGVTLWEIFSLACVPYPGLSWSPDFLKQLQLNMRLPQPDYASAELYELMRQCWEMEPNDRPTFTDILEFFCDYLKKFSLPTEYTELFTQDLSI